MDELKEGELVDVVIDVNADNEIERRVSTVDHLILAMLQEWALIFRTGKTLSYELAF